MAHQLTNSARFLMRMSNWCKFANIYLMYERN